MPNEKPKRKAKSAAIDPVLVELAGRVQAILLCVPAAIDRDALRLLLRPPRPLRTLEEVATVFGRSANTIGRSWRQTGMPGRPGAFDAVEILAWHLERDAKNRSRASGSGFDDDQRRELATIEVETARADLAFRQSRAQRATGEFVSTSLVVGYVRVLGNRLRDHVMRIPVVIEPGIPQRIAGAVCAEVERECRAAMSKFVEAGELTIEECTEAWQQIQTDRNGKATQ